MQLITVKRKDVNAMIRAARLLDPCIALDFPMCTIRTKRKGGEKKEHCRVGSLKGSS